MKKIFASLTFLLVLGFSVSAWAELDTFLDDLNMEARADMDGFSARLGTQFGVPLQRVKAVIKSVKCPADAFIVFQLGKMSGITEAGIVQVYKANWGRGWGAIARAMGISPGSQEYHALKRGDFTFTVKPGCGPGDGMAIYVKGHDS